MNTLQLGDELPDFQAESHMGMLKAHDYLDGAWGVIVAVPKIEDPVVCSQLG